MLFIAWQFDFIHCNLWSLLSFGWFRSLRWNTLRCYCVKFNRIFTHSAFSLGRRRKPLWAEGRNPHSLSSATWPLSSGTGYDTGGTPETFPAKAPIKRLTLHVVASFGSWSRCCKPMKSDWGPMFYCHFVWLKILDKPKFEWYCLPLKHLYNTEFIGKYTVFRLYFQSLLNKEFSRMGSGCCS